MVRVTNAHIMEKFEEVTRRLNGQDESLKSMQASISELTQAIRDLIVTQSKNDSKGKGPDVSVVSDEEDSDGRSKSDQEEGENSNAFKHKSGYQLVNRVTKLEFPAFDGEGFKDWSYKCNQFFELDNTPEQMKIRLVAIHLEGRALQRHQGFMKKMEGKEISWQTYIEELREQFVEGIISKPLIELRNLKQLATVSEYNNQFNALRNQVNIPSHMLLDLYLGGLTSEIMHTVQLLDPKSLNQAMKLARIQEGALYALWGVEPPKPPDPQSSPTYSLPNTHINTFSPSPTALPAPKFPPTAKYNQPKPTSYLNSSLKKPNVFVKNPTTHLANSQTKPTPVRQLTRRDYEEKRRNNQCFYCDEKYSPGHKCRTSKLFMVICPDPSESHLEFESNDECDASEIDQHQQSEELTISINALCGSSSLKTLQLWGFVKKQQVSMLVDSGSTHNFVDLAVAKRVGLCLTPIPMKKVSVADGFKLGVGYMVKGLRWVIQGLEYVGDFLAMDIGGYDVILGIQWLSTLGDIRCNFKQLFMEFWTGGRLVRLDGHKNIMKEMKEENEVVSDSLHS